MKNKHIIWALLAVSAFPLPSHAITSVAESDALQKRLMKSRIQPQPANNIEIKDQVAQADIPGAENVYLKLNTVSVEGNNVFSDEELASLSSDKIGQEVTLADVYAIRDAITKKYREAGYIISRAVIPQQQFNKGGADVKIQVVEGFVNSVAVQGVEKANMRIVNRYAEKIKQEGALNAKNLERYLLLMNDLAGTKASAVLTPSASGTGGTDIIIDLGHEKLDGTVTIDNSGSKFIGPYLATAEGNLNSALGLSEKITATVIAAPIDNELLSGRLAYSQPVGYEGTKLNFAASKTSTHPGSSLEVLDIVGDTTVYEAEVTHPFLRTRRENLSGRINFSAKATDTDALSTNLYEDKVRAVTLGGTYDLADRHGGVNLLDLSVTQGFDIFDASQDTDTTSRANGEGVFTRFNYEASRTQALVDKLVLFLASAGQYSNEGLLASEEFGFGGREFGRGYDFSEITGDAGVAAKVELQYGIDTTYKYLTNLQLYSFYDIGRVWQKDLITGEDPTTSAASAGAGVRFNITDSITGYTEVAKPLTKDLSAESDRDVRFSFGLSYVF